MSSYVLNGNYYIREYAGVIEISNDQISWTALFSFPISLTVQSDSTITFVNNTEYDNSTDYYIIESISGSLVIDGNSSLTHRITSSNYQGLFQNGTSSLNGNSNLTIKNFNMNCSVGSSLGVYCGWLCQEYFGNHASNILIENCNTNGDINEYAGGIAGQYFGNLGVNITINNCWSAGNMIYWAGGIVGICSNNCSITNCYSTGNIENLSGGIIGNASNSLSVSNCYSTGNINLSCGGIVGNECTDIFINNCYSIGFIGLNSGGIIGDENSNITISDCYSVGNILENAGGITGSNNSIVTITNCYSLGNIQTTTGGITGFNNSQININNCYSAGDISSTGGGIVGTINNNITLTNCYTIGVVSSGGDGLVNSSSYININIINSFAENTGIWNDINAYLYLTNDVWISSSINTPFLLKSFNLSPYSATVDTIYDGNSTNLSLLSTAYPYFKLINRPEGISINNTSGQIAASGFSQSISFNLSVYNYKNVNYGYNISNFYLNILSYSNSSEFNSLIQKVNNILLLTSNFNSTDDLIIYLPLSYVFNGQKYQIQANSIYFNILNNNSQPSNITTLITNTKFMPNQGCLIKNCQNILFSNSSFFYQNTYFHNNIVGNNCRNISIFNCKIKLSGTVVADNCKNISVIHSEIKVKTNKKYTATLTGKNNKYIKIKDNFLELKLNYKCCSSLLGYKNKHARIAHNEIIIKINKPHCESYVFKKSHNIKIYKSEIKIINNLSNTTTELSKSEVLEF